MNLLSCFPKFSKFLVRIYICTCILMIYILKESLGVSPIAKSSTLSYVWDSTNEEYCGGCPYGQYCYDFKCEKCSPCIDPFHGPKRRYKYVEKCKPVCPNICFEGSVGERPANQTLCDQIIHQEQSTTPLPALITKLLTTQQPTPTPTPPTLENTEPDALSSTSSYDDITIMPGQSKNNLGGHVGSTIGIGVGLGLGLLFLIGAVFASRHLLLALYMNLYPCKDKDTKGEALEKLVSDQQFLDIKQHEEDGQFATVSGMNRLITKGQVKGLMVCRCLDRATDGDDSKDYVSFRPVNDWKTKFIEVPSDHDSIKLKGFIPGRHYIIEAGLYDTKFICEKRKPFKTAKSCSKMSECFRTLSSCSYNAIRTLSIEMGSSVLVDLLVEFYKLTEDDCKSIKNIQDNSSRLDAFLEIINSQNEDMINIHDLMKFLNGKPKEDYAPVKHFVSKLAKMTADGSTCTTCFSILHESHSIGVIFTQPKPSHHTPVQL